MQSDHHIVIETKSSHKEHGRKIYASYDGKRIVRSWDYSLNADANHERAALEFIARKLDDGSTIRAYGSTKEGYVFLVR